MRARMLMLAAIAVAGCHGSPLPTDDAGTTSTPDLATSLPLDMSFATDLPLMPQPDLALPIYKLVSGTYAVSNLRSTAADTCQQNLTSANFAKLLVGNDGLGNLTLGATQVPYLVDQTLHEYGSGNFVDNVHGTTQLDATASDTTCQFHISRSVTVTVTANDTLDIQYQQTQTHRSACASKSDCSSAYAFTLHMN